MKLLLIALFVGLVSATTDVRDEPVEVIVNGLSEGEALEIEEILQVKVKEHFDGHIIANDPLFPFTAEGLDAAVPQPEEIQAPIVIVPEGVGLAPEIAKPELIAPPGPVIVVPAPEQPEIIPEQPEFTPEQPPRPVQPEIKPEQPEIAPEQPEIVHPLPEQAPNGEIFNDGIVQVKLNAENPGMLTTIQSWFSMVVNYFQGEQTTHQIV